MYTPPLFAEPDPANLRELVRRHPLGTLIATADDGSVDVTHVPFLLDESPAPPRSLRFHVSRANSIARTVLAARSVVAVFSGPDAYVSAAWYGDPTQQVPTWNYAVVHVAGRVDPLPDRRDVLDLLADLARAHEGPNPAWSIGRLDPGLRDKLVGEILAFRFVPTRWEGKFKLSQNREPADRERVRQALERRGTDADLEMVEWMRQPR